MSTAHNFMKAGNALDDQQLTGLIRVSLLEQQGDERLHWIRQVEVALDGYGGERHLALTTRIGDILRNLELELRGDATLTA